MASRLRVIDEYNDNRKALIALGMSSDRFPPVKIEDTYRKPTHTKRRLGDSRKLDGAIWTSNPSKPTQGTTDGWIWNIGSLGKMNDHEIKAWSEDGKCFPFPVESQMRSVSSPPVGILC